MDIKKDTFPNIIYIFADDLGYGDISCFGADDIATPNIDKIAREGIKFSSFYSASPLCSPSRAALLTGRFPQRMGINDVFFPESFTGMPSKETTIAEILKKKKYTTGIVGKWHLGHRFEFLPLQQGFDTYFGIPYSHDMESIVYMRNNDVVSYDVNLSEITRTYTGEALKFIEKNKGKPFFLYLAHNMPHVPLSATKDFLGTSRRGLYGDVVQELDWSVGQVLKKIEASGLMENTLIIFSSDNGPWLAMKAYGGSAGPLRGGKNTTFEGGMRVPTVAMWKGKIPRGSVYEDLATQMDWFPTIAAIIGVKLPKELVVDGEDISDVLFNHGKRKDQTLLYFNRENLEGFRNGDWKMKLPYKGNEASLWKEKILPHDTLLINLKQDLGEKMDLSAQLPKKVQQLYLEMKKSRASMGSLPASLIVRTPADRSHYDYLEKLENNKNK